MKRTGSAELVHLREGEDGDIRLHLRRQGDSGLLIINASRILNLNSTATFFVERILKGKTDSEIIKELKGLYRVSEQQANLDLQSLKDMIHTLSTTDDICPIHSFKWKNRL